MAVITGKKATVFLMAASSSATTGAINMVALDGATKKLYGIPQGANRAYRFWDTGTLTFQKDAVDVSAANIAKIKQAGGQVLFTAGQSTSTITVKTGSKYYAITGVADVREWALDVSVDLQEDTAFGDDWKTFIPTLLEGKITLTKFWADGVFFNHVVAGTLVGISLEVDQYKSYDCLARVNSVNVKNSVDSLVEESIELTVVGEITFNS